MRSFKTILVSILISSLAFADGNTSRQVPAATIKNGSGTVNVNTSGTVTVPNATDTLVGKATTDTLTNKSMSGGSNTFTSIPLATAVSGQLPVGNGGTGQATAAAGFDALAPTTTNGDLITRAGGTNARVAVGSSGQVLKVVGGAPTWATFSGGINYLSSNPDAESDTSGWSTYADAAATTPVDGTGGSPSATWTRTTTTPLRGSGSFLFTKGATNRQGDGVSFPFTADTADQAKPIAISFDYTVASGTYASNDLAVYVYDVTNSTLTQPAPYNILNATAGLPQKWIGYFQTASNSTSYRLIIHAASTSASAYTVKFDNFNVGPTYQPYGAVATDMVAYTPTLTSSGGGAVTLNATSKTDPNGFYRRVGDSAEITVSVKNGSGGAASGTAGSVLFSLPSGLTMDTAKLDTSVAGGPVLGVAVNGGATPTMTVLYSDSTHVRIQDSSGNIVSVATLASSYALDLKFKAPIVGWSSNVQVSSDADTRVVAAVYTGGTTSLVNNVTTTYIPTTKVIDTHAAYSTGTGIFTVPVAGQYRVTCIFSGAASQTPASAAKRASYALIYKNGSAVRYGPESISLQNSVATTAEGFVSGIVDAVAGDTLNCAGFQNLGANGAVNNSAETSANFERISGPAQIAASESIVASYGGLTNSGGVSSGTPDTVKYPTKRVDTHSIMDTSTGIATIPAPGIYEVHVSVGGVMTATSAAMSCYVNVNGSDVAGGQVTGGATITSREQICQTATYTARFVQGDTIKGRAKDGTAGTNYSDGVSQSSIVITKVGN
jgi:hypothetical protein